MPLSRFKAEREELISFRFGAPFWDEVENAWRS